MRTSPILIALAISSLSACSLYFDDESEGKGTLATVDAGSSCADGGCTPGSCSDGGIDGCVDGGVDGGSWHPDGGTVDGGGAPDAP